MSRHHSLFFALLLALVLGVNIRAAQAGTPIGWTQTITTASYGEGYTASMDAGGNVYVAGLTMGVAYGVGQTDHFENYAAKYSSNGTLLWNHVWEGSGQYAIKPDNAGNAYVIVNDGLQKFDAAGNLLWSSSLNMVTNTGLASAAVAVDNSGNAYVTGADAGTLQPFVAKLNSAGTVSWTTALDAPTPRQCAISVNSSGSTVVVANSSAGGSDSVAQLAKLDASGTKYWSANYGQASKYTFFGGVAIDGTGSTYLTINSNSHLYSDSSDGMDNYLVKLTPGNNMLWHKSLSESSWNSSLAIDPAGFEYAVTQDGPIQKYNAQGAVVGSYQWNTDATSLAFGGGYLSAVNYTFSNGYLSTVLSGKIGVVPEPSAFLLLGTSLSGLLFFAWWRRRS